MGLGEEGSGSLASIPLALVYVFSMRNSLITFLLGISFERQLLWHKLTAYCSVILGLLHYFEAQGEGGDEEVTGLVILISMGVIVVFSQTPIRRFAFNLFLRFHWILFLVITLFAALHEAGLVVVGFGVFMTDMLIRCVIIYINKSVTSKSIITKVSDDVVKVTFPKQTFQYKGGQYLFICIPKVSYFEWHPFSISSSPHEENVTIHIKALGDWTKLLLNLVEQNGSLETNIFVGGPYGNPSLDIDSDKYKCFMFISGGIGATPMRSISQEIISQTNEGRPMKKIMYIWSVRDLQLVSALRNKNNDQENPTGENKIDSYLDERIYCSKLKADSEQKQATADCKEVLAGRPDLDKLFLEMHDYAIKNNEKRVAVLSCGPGSLINNAVRLAVKYSYKGVTFDFHSELFEF